MVAVPGWLRLIIEVLVFGGAVAAFYLSGKPTWAMVFGTAVVVHYLVSYDRILRLLRPG